MSKSTSAPVGAVFGRLTVLTDPFPIEGKSRKYVMCECACGKLTFKAPADLASGNTRSCGCFAKEQSSIRESSHGMTASREYNVWKGIKQRCTNPNHAHYKSYGARGITMCDRWFTSFESFLSDMGPRPEGMTIDRIDNERGYSPDNCRWATQKTQSNNVRSNRRVEWMGMDLSIAEASEFAVVDYATLLWRISREWDIQKAMTEPSRNPSNRVNRHKKKPAHGA